MSSVAFTPRANKEIAIAKTTVDMFVNIIAGLAIESCVKGVHGPVIVPVSLHFDRRCSFHHDTIGKCLDEAKSCYDRVSHSWRDENVKMPRAEFFLVGFGFFVFRFFCFFFPPLHSIRTHPNRSKGDTQL